MSLVTPLNQIPDESVQLEERPVDLTGASDDEKNSHQGESSGSNSSEGSEEAASPYRETEKFKTWRKHIRDLYQTLVHFETRWESRTVDILPFLRQQSDGCAEQTILTGTYTGGNEQNYVELSTITMPARCLVEPRTFDSDIGEIGGFGLAPNSVSAKTVLRMYHDGDVLKARHMPANPHIIATASSDTNIYLFDRTTITRSQKPNNPERRLLPRPEDPEVSAAISAEAKLQHKKRLDAFNEAYHHQQMWDAQRGEGQHRLKLVGLNGPATTLEWDTTRYGRVAAAAKNTVCVWEAATLPKSTDRKAGLAPHFTAEVACEINDLRWHPRDSNVFALALEKEGIAMHDYRAKGSEMLLCRMTENGGMGALSVDWSPMNPYVAAFGGHNGQVGIFDIRAPNQILAQVTAHRQGTEVPRVSFSPHVPGLIASGGEDSLVNIVDFSYQGAPVVKGSPATATISKPTDAAGRVLFRHAGHTSIVSDVQWCKHECYAGLVMSVDETGVISWKPRDEFWK